MNKKKVSFFRGAVIKKPSDLIAHYTFDNTYNDKYNNFNPDIANPPFVAGLVNNAVEFATGSNYRFEIPHNDLFSFTDNITDKPFSIDFIAKFYSTSGGWICSKRDFNGYPIEWQIFVYGGKLKIYCFDTNNSNYISAETVSSIPINSFDYYAISYNGNGLPSGFKINKNGVDLALTTSTVGTYNCMKITTNKVSVGNPIWSTIFNFEGILDELRILSTELTLSEKVAKFNEYF